MSARLDGVSVCVSRPALTARPAREPGEVRIKNRMALSASIPLATACKDMAKPSIVAPPPFFELYCTLIGPLKMKAEAIAIAEAEQHMAEANVENAQAVVEQRQAALDQARLDLDRTVLRAPIDGIIIKRDVNPGQTVAVSLEAKTLFKIANDLREMEVHGKIDEADVGQLKGGQTALFTVDAYPDRTFSGQVLQIRKSPEVVQNVVTYTTIVSAPNPDLLLRPGMTPRLG